MTVTLHNLLGRTVTIRRAGDHGWTIRQRHSGHYEHNQAATWVSIVNTGKPRTITVRLVWAECAAMEYRRWGYLRVGRRHQVLTGAVGTTATTYTFTAPHGECGFGRCPWYDNTDADRFLRRAGGDVELIGHTLEGRPIRSLVMRPRARRNVVVLAREHATETAGSFAVEKVVKHLLAHRRAQPGFAFHIIPIANPDGVANGTKHPQDAPIEVSDLHYAGMTTDDPTCRAVREYLLALRPAGIINYHGYLWPMPQLIYYDRRDGLAMHERLLNDDPNDAPSWYFKRQVRERHTMPGYCHQKFGSVVALYELPWANRTITQVRRLGLDMFLAAMHASRLAP